MTGTARKKLGKLAFLEIGEISGMGRGGCLVQEFVNAFCGVLLQSSNRRGPLTFGDRALSSVTRAATLLVCRRSDAKPEAWRTLRGTAALLRLNEYE